MRTSGVQIIATFQYDVSRVLPTDFRVRVADRAFHQEKGEPVINPVSDHKGPLCLRGYMWTPSLRKGPPRSDNLLNN